MKLNEVINDAHRTEALKIQTYVIDEFDTDATAASGNQIVSCDLNMELGFPAAKLSIDLPYYKSAFLLYYERQEGAYRISEAREPYEQVGCNYDSIPEMIEQAIEILLKKGHQKTNHAHLQNGLRKRIGFPS